ncbi:MAG: amino acid permease, partial [Cyanobacteria bacterium J06648_11]
MYLRFGWVVGNVGLVGTLAIVTISTSITFLTALSVCAISTDRVVRAGGAYYMISRSLGIETGGAVGIPLYFAQALSVALYTIGFADSLVSTFQQLDTALVTVATTMLVTVVAITSARWAIRVQYVIMAAIALSLIAFAFGHPVSESSMGLFGAPVSDAAPFWSVFAVFFPAVTGIMTGVNMSGDLEDPTKSIPAGTLWAVGTGYTIYMTLPLFLALRADAATLVEEQLIMQQMALWGPSILLGVWGATLSSALGSILGAPRVLQALVRDRVLPSWMRALGTGEGEDDEPRIGTMVTLGVALIAVAIGDLNAIAPVLTMFFLTTYLVLNVAAGIEGFLQ